ncbi:MAG TPA: inositol monophosphatase family protein [Sphingomicrobium sp.]|nr:inositol monophosphatase family protein [Sphingomicrobium sp.]
MTNAARQSSETSPLLSAMIDAARLAGDGLREDFLKISSLEIERKIGPDPVSAADLRSEKTLQAALSSACPDYGFLGEEGGLVEGADQSSMWVVDPLDGTANFLCGLPLFAVNVALVSSGKVVAGVTHLPMLGETFWAEVGGGAWLNGNPIHVSGQSELIRSILAVGIPFAGKPRHGQFVAEMERLTEKVLGLRRLGAAAVDMAYVACGRFDAYWEQSLNAWDMAAGVVIVEEAGGTVTDTLGGPLDLMGGTVLASTPGIHSELVVALDPVDA